MKYCFKLSVGALIVATALSQGTAQATNGMMMPGYGLRAQGMGGVGIAYGRDSLSVGANPANIVNTGMRGDIGFAVLNAESHAATGHGTGVQQNPPNTFAYSPYGFDGISASENKYFIMPEMGMTMPLTENLHVGLAFLPQGGGASRYPQNFFSYNGTTPPKDTKLGIELMQLMAPISVGYKVNETQAVGASLNIGVQRFRAFGLQAFQVFDLTPTSGVTTITADPDHLTNQGFNYSFGAGIKLGWLGEFLDHRLTIGLAYTSRTFMTKFDKYRGLFAQQGDMDFPENYGIGIALKPVKNLVIAADVMQILYSDVNSIGDRGPGTHPKGNQFTQSLNGLPSHLDPSKELGNDNGMGFGFRDQIVYKLGVQYGVNKRLLVRAGYNYGHSPIPNDQLTFATLAPATTERHYSLGFTYKASDELEVTGMYMYVPSHPQENLSRQNVVSAAQVDMHQNVFGVALGWVLDPGPRDMEEYGSADWAGIDFTNWYVGFGFGQSQYRDVASYIDAKVASVGATQTSSSNLSEGWKVYAGYQVNKYIGLEGGYVNLNDMAARTTTAAGILRTNVDTDGWTLSAVATLPLSDKFSVIGKLGAAYLLADIRAKTGTNLAQDSGDDSYGPYYGVGVSYALLDNLNLRAEWERFDRKDLNIDLLTAGMVVKF